MPNATIPLTSFTGGEWSPRLHGRVDIAKYSSACEVLKNMVIYPHGGITRRMGMEYIGNAKTNAVRLIPFEYNREQAYVLEFGNGYIRFFRDGGQVQSGGVPLEIASPFTTAHLPDIAFTQSADALFLVHPSVHPQRLGRTGADVFSIANATIIGQNAANDPRAMLLGGFPGSVVFFQSRLLFSGHPTKPQTIWMSESLIFSNFTMPASTATKTAIDPIEVTLSSNQVNAIQWMVAGKKLLVGTTGGEWTLSGSGDSPITGSNIRAERESNFGSNNGRVQLVGNGVLYSSRDGKKIREMSYRYESEGFDSPELSLFSEHLTRPGVKDYDFAQNPDGILWVVLNNGDFCGMTYLKSQDVQGWHRHETDGDILSVCTIEGPTSSEVWFAVLRNGAVRIELMKPAYEGETANSIDCAYLDSHLSYTGVPTSTLSGLEHLNGKIVSVLADGQYLTDKTVVAGAITIEVAASNIIVGLPYQWKVRPLKLEGGSPTGFSQGKMKSVDSVVVRLERSSGINHTLPGELEVTPIPSRQFGDNFNEAIKLFTGDIEIKLRPNWDRKGQIELSGDSPFPVTILMISARVAVNE